METIHQVTGFKYGARQDKRNTVAATMFRKMKKRFATLLYRIAIAAIYKYERNKN
jgi:hypothetical protein